MPEPDPLSPADEADLVALADGRLDAQRAEALLARVADDPRLAAALDRQRAAVAAISAAASDVVAPAALRARIEELEQAAATRRGRRSGWLRRSARDGGRASGAHRPGWLRMPRLAGGLVLAACAALALVLVLGRGGATVDSVLAVATRPPAGVAAIGVPGGPLLDEELDGVRFPNYAARFGWEPDGVRRDDVDGRITRTVFYRRGGRRIAYSVVSGDTLRTPVGARAERREGVALLALRRAGRTVVVWTRQAHTCVLSGEGVAADELLELASWKGRGQVRF